MIQEEDFSVEEQEEKEGYFAKAAQSEFQRVVAAEKRKQRLGKVSFLRSIGRKARLDLSVRHGKHWSKALNA